LFLLDLPYTLSTIGVAEMSFGLDELQVVMSAGLLVVAALAALICDYLRSRNELLRASNARLRAKQSVLEGRTRLLEHAVNELLSAQRLPLSEMAERRLMEAGVAPPQDLVPGAVRIRKISESDVEPGADCTDSRGVVVPMPSPANRAPQPTGVGGGWWTDAELAVLTAQATYFRGLAVVIGLVDYQRLISEDGPVKAADWLTSVEEIARGFVSENCFGCRSGVDEFTLLLPDQHGPSAQRVLATLSERLWEFQLNTLGSSVVFTWGAAECEGGPLDEILDHARQQLRESRWTRRTAINRMQRDRRQMATA